MRFAITGIDMYHVIFHELVKAGWTPLKLFTWPTDGIHDTNRNVIGHAASLKLPIQMHRMQEKDLIELKDMGCEVLVSSGYAWRIRDWQKHIPYAVNFHPSLLPEARGAWPLPQAILSGAKRWGSTVHKIAEEFDTGDILGQEAFDISSHETHQSLILRCQMSHQKLVRRLSQNFISMWQQAEPQKGGSYWPRFEDSDRTLNWNETVAQCLLRFRAFNNLEVVAKVMDSTFYVYALSGWQESHNLKPGELAHTFNKNIIVAVKDGFIALERHRMFSLDQAEYVT